MKGKKFLALLCSIFCILPNCSCSMFAKSKVLAEPAQAEELNWRTHNEENFVAFKEKTNAFSAKFSSAAYATHHKNSNFAVSPISVFMALGMAAECSLNETQTQILNALNVNLAELRENYPKLYASLHVKHTSKNVMNQEKTLGMLQLSNSIWLDESLSVKQTALDVLANTYYSYAHEVDFGGDNQNANAAIKNFIKQQTNGLIKRDFNLSPETIFTLINTLYLKDVWKYNGDEIDRTNEAHTFINSDASTANQRLLQGKYITGRAYTTDSYSAYYTTTYHGYKIKFLLPNEGYTVTDIFTANNLESMNAVKDFDAEDEENLIRYHTRCLFPEYKSEYNGDVKDILQQQFGITSLFEEQACDFTALTDSKPAFCSGVIHQTSLEVNRKGIEGAAVTIIPGAGAPGPDEYKNVYVDFIVNKAFGFILTDAYNTVIFSGVVKNI